MANPIANGKPVMRAAVVALVLALCAALASSAVAQPARYVTVQAPPGKYAYTLIWEEAGQQAQRGPEPVESLPLRVDLSVLPPGAQKARLSLSEREGARSAVASITPGQSLTLKPEDFRYLTRLTVRLVIPDRNASYAASVTLLQPPEPSRTKDATIVGGKAEIVFELVPLGAVTLRVEGKGLKGDEAKVPLVSPEGKPVTDITRNLQPTGEAPPPGAPRRLDALVSNWARTLFLVSLLAALLAAVVALVEHPGKAIAGGLTNWLLWLVPLLGLGLSAATTTAMAYRESTFGLQALWSLAGVAVLFLAATLAEAGRRIAAAAATAALAASLVAPIAFAEPVSAALGPVAIAIVLSAIWALAAAGYIAAQVPRAAPAAAPQAEAGPATPGQAAPGICPFCGTPRDPLTGQCACTVGAQAPAAAVAPQVQQPTLLGDLGEVAGKQFPLSPNMTLGRDPAADIALTDKTVSRHHCTLELAGEEVRVHDEGSANGTFINGQRITDGVLRSSDVLQVGGARFRLLLP